MMKMDEKKGMLTGDERDEDDGFGEETFTGDELDEDDGFGDEMFTGGELDEDDGFGDEMFTGGELDEDDGFGEETFTGDELSEDDGSGDLPGEKGKAKEKTRAAVSRTAPSSSLAKRSGGKWLWIMGAMALVTFMGAGSFLALHYKRVAHQAKEQSFPMVSVPIPPKNEIWLKDFLIPLALEHLYTCVTFSVVIQSWDNSVIHAMAHEKQWLRGMMYDILIKKINAETETPSVETFRKWVRQAVRHALPDSHIDTVNIRNFLVI